MKGGFAAIKTRESVNRKCIAKIGASRHRFNIKPVFAEPLCTLVLLMAEDTKPVVVIPKEEAVFRLDAEGVWHNADQKFENRKIIDYFHSMIRRDDDGFFLEQEHAHFIERVYFPYEETALFVFRVSGSGGSTLHLNTGQEIRLDPGELFVRNDRLYLRHRKDLIKFSEEAAFALADMMDEEPGGRYVIHWEGKRRVVPRRDEAVDLSNG